MQLKHIPQDIDGAHYGSWMLGGFSVQIFSETMPALQHGEILPEWENKRLDPHITSLAILLLTISWKGGQLKIDIGSSF